MLHTIARVATADGGPSRTVVALCRALASEGVRVELLTGSVEDSDLGFPVRVAGTVRRWGREQPPRGRFAALVGARLAGGFGIVHDHGMWLSSNRAAADAARRARAARIVSPRGMLSEWALAWRGRRKRAAWHLFQRRDLDSADALHATSDLEAREFRAAGLEVPIAVVPNGVDLPALGELDPGETRPRRVLFLSRIHPKKGLSDLIEAWGTARPAGWELLIAGPDEGGHRGEIEARARALGPDASVRFHGPVPDAGKWDLYRTADVFVLPSRSENFGMVVAEALACGVPAIATRAAPWEALDERSCGWWTDAGVEPLARALTEATGLGDDERRAMGARGRRLVEERFGWPAVARRMLAVYRWLGGETDAPDWVRRD